MGPRQAPPEAPRERSERFFLAPQAKNLVILAIFTIFSPQNDAGARGPEVYNVERLNRGACCYEAVVAVQFEILVTGCASTAAPPLLRSHCCASTLLLTDASMLLAESPLLLHVRWYNVGPLVPALCWNEAAPLYLYA